MIISDRISAFDCNWHGENGLSGVPGKGAALNAIANYWFKQFDKEELAGNHILATPHPLVWIVQKAEPIMVEAIARQYLTGSMWRAYSEGARVFCGITLPDGLENNQRLPNLLKTPTTKGIMKGIPGIPDDKDDVNITKEQIEENFEAFGFKSIDDVAVYEKLLTQGFDLISKNLAKLNQIFVDTKFEFGYVKDANGNSKIMYIDEVGTPDSSRMWDLDAYANNQIVENSKEGFRQFLLNTLDRNLLLKGNMPERKALAKSYDVPVEQMMTVSKVYTDMAEKITGEKLPKINHAREELLDSLAKYKILE